MSKIVILKIGTYWYIKIFHNIVIRNNIKVSYSCMPKIKSAIFSHKNNRFFILLLTTKVANLTALIKQTAFYKKNGRAQIPYMRSRYLIERLLKENLLRYIRNKI